MNSSAVLFRRIHRAAYRRAGVALACLCAVGLGLVPGRGAAQALPPQPGVTPWERLPDLPLARVGAASAWIGGKFVVAGGSYWEEGRKYYADRVDAYDPASRRWEELPSLPLRLSNSGHTTDGQSLYTIGGQSDGRPTDRCLRLVQQAGEWRWLELPRLPAPGLYGAAGIHRNTLCYAGGTTDPIDLRRVRAETWRLDLSRPGEGWRRGQPVPGRPRCLGPYAVSEGQLYFMGGCAGIDDSRVQNLAEVARYDIGRDRWSKRKPLPRALRAAAAVGLPGGRIAILGGHSGGPYDGERYGLGWGFERRVLLYDPRRERFKEGAPLLEPVVDPPAGFHEGRVYLAGGEDRARSRTALAAAAPLPAIQKPETTRPIWVCLGDSVTHGVGRSGVAEADAYPRRLEQAAFALPRPPWVLNGGRGGETTRGAIERLPSLLKPLPRVDLVVVMYGLNDASLIDPGPVARTGPRVSVADYRENLRALIVEARRHGARVVLCTPNPMTPAYRYAGFGAYAGKPNLNFALEPFAEAARSLARQEKVPLADVYRLFVKRRQWEALLPDGIHPNAAGLALVAQEVGRVAGVPPATGVPPVGEAPPPDR